MYPVVCISRTLQSKEATHGRMDAWTQPAPRACSPTGIERSYTAADPVVIADGILQQMAEKPLKDRSRDWLQSALDAFEEARAILQAGIRGNRKHYDSAIEQIQSHLVM